MARAQSVEIMTYAQAAKYLSLPEGTLRALVHHGRVPHLRIAERTVRFRRSRLDEWLESKESERD